MVAWSSLRSMWTGYCNKKVTEVLDGPGAKEVLDGGHVLVTFLVSGAVLTAQLLLERSGLWTLTRISCEHCGLNPFRLWETTTNPDPQFLRETGCPTDSAGPYLIGSCITDRRKVRKKSDKKLCSFVR